MGEPAISRGWSANLKKFFSLYKPVRIFNYPVTKLFPKSETARMNKVIIKPGLGGSLFCIIAECL